jgi:hypothetical protein
MMPRKQWTAFEKVTAADVNASLADQSVMVFATTTARDAAIPSPSTGMQSAVTASPDLGAPRYWDGSAWTLVKSGFLYPNILTLASTALDVGTMRFGPQNMTQNVWYEVTASMPQDSVIFAAVSSSQQGRFEFGIGASGSEVLRLDLGNRMANWPGNGDFPYGVFVASGQRVALRNITTNTVGTDMTFIFATNQTRDAVQQRALQSTNNIGSTSWTEIATTPPVAAGVWVIGYAYYQGSASGGTFRFGTGAAGSEVAVTSYITANNTNTSLYNGVSHIAPFFWPPGTRLAAQTSLSHTANIMDIIWRETLT